MTNVSERSSLLYIVYFKFMEKQKISLVLSMGGARGIAHIGVIETLLEYGYEIAHGGCHVCHRTNDRMQRMAV